MYHRLEIKGNPNLDELRKQNYIPLTEDRFRCAHCQGFYWRLWVDMAQCLGCQNYSIIEVDCDKHLEIGIGQIRANNLLQVGWILEQVRDKYQVDITKRVKDPISDRTEFIIFKDRLRCRVTGTETLISPNISGSWILNNSPKIESKVLTEEEALKLVKNSKNSVLDS